MFSGINSLISLDVSNFNTGNVTNMSGMFEMHQLTALDLSGFDTRNVIAMDNMLGGLTFGFTSHLNRLAFGEHFHFVWNIGMPFVPTNDTFTGYWRNVGTGTVNNPQGEYIFTSVALVENFDGATMADTWVWQTVANANFTESMPTPVIRAENGRLHVEYAAIPTGASVANIRHEFFLDNDLITTSPSGGGTTHFYNYNLLNVFGRNHFTAGETYAIRVRVIDASGEFLPSEFSNTALYTPRQFPTPIISLSDGIITVTDELLADGNAWIYLNGIRTGIVARATTIVNGVAWDNTFDLLHYDSRFVNNESSFTNPMIPGATYTIQVRRTITNSPFLSSELSNPVQFTRPNGYQHEIIYSPNDIAVINAIITNNGLNATIANPADGSFVPADWTFASWSPPTSHRRISELHLGSQSLTGNLDVRGLNSLVGLVASNNQLTSVNVTGLPALISLDVRYNNMTSTANVIGYSNPPTTNFQFVPQNAIPETGGGGGYTPQETPEQPADTTTTETGETGEILDLIEDPVSEVDPLSPEALDTITDADSAVDAAQNAVDHLLGDDVTLTSDDLDLLAQFLENAIARAASMEIDGNLIIVNRPNVEALQDTAQEVVEQVEAMLEAYDIELNRYLNTNVFFVTTDFAQVDVRVEPSAMLTDVDQVWIRTPYYGLSFSMEFIENNAHSPLYIHITSENGDFTAQYTLPATLGVGIGILNSPVLNAPIPQNRQRLQAYRIEFSRPVSEPVRVSVPPVAGDRTFQTLKSDDGRVVSSRYNQVTGFIDARVQHSGRYVVVENQVDFTDILHRSAEMQNAIRVLASQGILEGVAPLQFSPDDPINRAQFAAIVVRMLGIHDENADGGFVDVSRNDWFFSFAGSARQHGLMEGTGNNVFSPTMNMPNEQLVVLGARILRTEARFRTPANPQQELQQRFTDANELANWSVDDLALAARENLIVPRADGRFAPRDTITRGDAALMLYRVYRRIW